MDGLLIIDKPEGFTSHDVVARVRRILQTRRVGHTGTLDPFATGVMVILVGKATRLARFLDKDEKEYEAVVRFGFETETGDRTGAQRDEEAPRRGNAVTTEEVEKVLPLFTGEIEQTPPMYSAKKVQGQKLYEMARRGIEIERKPVRVTISKLELIGPSTTSNIERTEQPDIRLRVVCSAGTYIRTLAEDIGRRMGVGAHLSELRRTRAGRFEIASAMTLDELADLEDPASKLVPVEQAVVHLPELRLSADRAEKTRNGLSTRVDGLAWADGEAVRMTSQAGELVAVGIYRSDEKLVQPKVVLV